MMVLGGFLRGVCRSYISRGFYVGQLDSQRHFGRSFFSVKTRYNSGQVSVDAKEKIENIIDQICKLTLLETADLVKSLKNRLDIPDLPVGGGYGPAVTATPSTNVEQEEETVPVPKQEKTVFSVKLESFETGNKPKVIKEIKSLLGLSLVDSKKFVESAPKVIRESMTKEDAEKLIETFKTIGAVVSME